MKKIVIAALLFVPTAALAEHQPHPCFDQEGYETRGQCEASIVQKRNERRPAAVASPRFDTAGDWNKFYKDLDRHCVEDGGRWYVYQPH